jgi:hypothetical protein
MFKRIKQTSKGFRSALLALMVVGNIALAVPIFFRAKALDPVGRFPTTSKIVLPSMIELLWSSAILWFGVYIIMVIWLRLADSRKKASRP